MLLDTATREVCHIERFRFNGHPPLGVNATEGYEINGRDVSHMFQRAPTLGGECYAFPQSPVEAAAIFLVSTGTHPWG